MFFPICLLCSQFRTVPSTNCIFFFQNSFLPYLRKFALEREGILLRCSLVGGMFDSVCHQTCCDAWALLFFQLMLYGAISREKDGYVSHTPGLIIFLFSSFSLQFTGILFSNYYSYLFESCYDMLSTVLIWSITDPANVSPVNSQDPDTKYRFGNYVSIVKKLKVLLITNAGL